MLVIHNDLINAKEAFSPLMPGKVGLYVCGMTVYDYCHLGHARVLVAFDVVYRYLRSLGYEVTYVRNITDIDDKIIKRANENAESWQALTGRFIQAMHEDAAALAVLPPDLEPRATEHLAAIIAMTERLIERGHAYVAANGDVYYEVRSFEGYGKLSGKSIDDLRAGARVDPGEQKRDPLDFVLWKAAKPGEPSWDSPWGAGRPGWHIECSAMSTQALGDTFDIHGGGADLAFPHHENEIAQSEGATGHPFVRYWMHNGFVRINEEKMSKSLGNFFSVREVLKDYRPEEIRYFILTSHYRSPLNYSDEQLQNARQALQRLYTALSGLSGLKQIDVHTPPAETSSYRQAFAAAMDDDFNTPEALAVLFELARAINRQKVQDPVQATALGAVLVQLGNLLGILQSEPDAWLKGQHQGAEGLDDAAIESLINQRLAARQAKDWAEADRIRDLLKAKGILLEDGAGGTGWRRA
jgi:cysteinyl-tRNA synthetase